MIENERKRKRKRVIVVFDRLTVISCMHACMHAHARHAPCVNHVISWPLRVCRRDEHDGPDDDTCLDSGSLCSVRRPDAATYVNDQSIVETRKNPANRHHERGGSLESSSHLDRERDAWKWRRQHEHRIGESGMDSLRAMGCAPRE
jgi:hypothetical protein